MRKGVVVMDRTDLLHYKTLLLANQQELSGSKSRAGWVPAASEPWGYPAPVATTEAGATMQNRLSQVDSKLLEAIEDALARIRQERFGTCEECGQPISKARLEAVPWARHCKDCEERQDPRT
jgi:DnaK suppressor protein